jgi:octaprenyl-diphosphate synthase
MEALAPTTAAMPLSSRWYAPLAVPAERAIAAALRRVSATAPSTDPWCRPRTGLATAWMVRLSETYGTRRAQGLAQAAVVAELYNLYQLTGAPTAAEQQAWARAESRALRRGLRAGLSRERPWALSVLSVWSTRPLSSPQPEAVLWLRAATGFAALAAHIPTPIHKKLDVVAMWMGLWQEERHGDRSDWEAACASVGEPLLPPEDGLRRALLELPDSQLHEHLLACLAPAVSLPGRREVPRWQAEDPPPLVAAPDSDLLGAHGPAVGAALSAVVSGGIYAATGRWLLERGGKRVRPALTLAAAEACGGDPADAVGAAALVEWLHQASLVLDDMMDGAALRRGGPTLHIATSAPSALGAFAWLLDQIRRVAAGLPADQQEVLLDGARQLIGAQHEEVLQTGQISLSESAYFRILAGKTAALFGVAVRLGARSAGAGAREEEALSEFARSTGVAFQLIDDLLDYTGTEEGFGKAPGTDLRARKITLPVMLLRTALPRAARARLDALLQAGGASDEDLRWIQAELTQRGIDDQIRDRVRAHRDRAERALARLPDPDAADRLRALSAACTERSR